MMMLALAVISQDFDDPASGDLAMSASRHHPVEFLLERQKRADAQFYLGKAGAGDFVGGGAGMVRLVLQHQKGADGFHLEAEFTAWRMKASLCRSAGS